MKVVLSRDIKNVGKVGEICVVKDGYGRNFLLPKGYAIIANKNNIAKVQEKIELLKKQNSELAEIAKQVADLLTKKVFNIIRQAADDGAIYGSVRNRDVRSLVCELIHENKMSFSVDVGSIKIETPIKTLGQYLISINLFGDISSKIRLNICRTAADFDDSIENFDKKYTEFLAGVDSQKKKQQDVVINNVASNNTEQSADAKNDVKQPDDATTEVLTAEKANVAEEKTEKTTKKIATKTTKNSKEDNKKGQAE